VVKKVLIVTGGSGGIGAEVAKLACEKGYAVCINYHSSKDKARAIYKKLKEFGYSVILVKADISNESEVISLFSQTKEKLGNVSALVNNAGIITPITKLEFMDKKRLQKVFDINVIGSFLCAKEGILHISKK
jgi:NAD(P)-dependent dehydrogenase (short-subunit alcohol dehydrogenase family)